MSGFLVGRSKKSNKDKYIISYIHSTYTYRYNTVKIKNTIKYA